MRATMQLPQYIPLITSRSSVPGWTEHVKPLRDKSIFRHTLWMDCGHRLWSYGIASVVAESMRRTRAT